MASYSLNEEAVARARQLIEARQYVLESNWGEVQPRADAENAFLDYKAPSSQHYGYCVFGKVVGGKDIVDRITGVATGRSGMHENVPTDDVVITRAEEVA